MYFDSTNTKLNSLYSEHSRNYGIYNEIESLEYGEVVERNSNTSKKKSEIIEIYAPAYNRKFRNIFNCDSFYYNKPTIQNSALAETFENVPF